MAMNKGQKSKSFQIAVEITKAFGNCGDLKIAPSAMLKGLYDCINEITEDVIKTPD